MPTYGIRNYSMLRPMQIEYIVKWGPIKLTLNCQYITQSMWEWWGLGCEWWMEAGELC